MSLSRSITPPAPFGTPLVTPAAEWTAADPTLAAGQMGIESDTGYIKVGDGTTAWAALPYYTGPGVATSDGTTGGTGSAGSGSQYVLLTIGGATYRLLHDGTV
jgi:hypothetical protein